MMIIEISSIAIQLNLKAIKNSHISVLPLDGCVSAPECMIIAPVRVVVIRRIP